MDEDARGDNCTGVPFSHQLPEVGHGSGAPECFFSGPVTANRGAVAPGDKDEVPAVATGGGEVAGVSSYSCSTLALHRISEEGEGEGDEDRSDELEQGKKN